MITVLYVMAALGLISALMIFAGLCLVSREIDSVFNDRRDKR